MRRLVFLILVMSTMTYLIVGSVVFHYLEDFSETQHKKSLARAHAEFIAHHPDVNQTELLQLIMTAFRTHQEGISISAILERNISGNASLLDDDKVVTTSKWDIASGFLFCITVISTIGYGNMVPRTWGGQLFCIFYALFGIPIFGAVLVGTGERLQIPIKKLHQCRPWVKDNPIKDQKLKSILLLSTGMSVIVFIPAWVFTITEDWSYLEGMYYSVITLTTVGFGDLVPESIFTETG
ncbi:potassium channel subfamily K member 16 [Elysia marginata]|uniref:Potassium channel subfamily K member 16 n=1 Tax=Elysia marginata TaxID=1093978 RepID=A0AAV4I7F6_9GAST|nr:potassium channel subfamily K member 16 [Elysia marginata]